MVLRFAPEKELLLSGMITGGNEIAEKPAVVDVPHGKGHVVLFANNPMWRAETMGSFFLVFNAMLNFDHLDAGAKATGKAQGTATVGGEDVEESGSTTYHRGIETRRIGRLVHRLIGKSEAVRLAR